MPLTPSLAPEGGTIMSTKSIEQRLQEVEDRVAIKAIVDTFSNLADKQEFAALVMLLTEDAEVDFYFGETLAGSWKGRAAFSVGASGYVSSSIIMGVEAATTGPCRPVEIATITFDTASNTSTQNSV